MSFEISNRAGASAEIPTMHSRGHVEIAGTHGEYVAAPVAELLASKGWGEIVGEGDNWRFEPADNVTIRDIDRNAFAELTTDFNPLNWIGMQDISASLAAAGLPRNR